MTVSTHLRTMDKWLLEQYCAEHGTRPYQLVRDYLLSLCRVEMSRLTQDEYFRYLEEMRGNGENSG